MLGRSLLSNATALSMQCIAHFQQLFIPSGLRHNVDTVNLMFNVMSFYFQNLKTKYFEEEKTFSIVHKYIL